MTDNNGLELNAGSRSDTGLVRDENQDRMLRFSSPFGEVFLVSDGMGGYRGGARAAEMVGDGIFRHLNSLERDTPVDVAMRTAAEKTNEEILGLSRDTRGETAGMGATLVMAILREGALLVGHAGDSRAYLCRNHELRQLTRDHTQGRDNVDAGLLTEVEVFDHLSSSVLTRAFGHSDPLELEISPSLTVESGDQILLCSDGLSGYVPNTAIAEVLARGLGPQQAADLLVQAANDAGGADNVTVQIILAGSLKRIPVRRNRTTLLERLPVTAGSQTRGPETTGSESVSKAPVKRFWRRLFPS